MRIKRFMTMETSNRKDIYKEVGDFALATVISLFYPIEAIDRKNPRKAQFLFKQTDALDQLIERYWRGELRVEPQAYFNAMRIIKSRLYSEA